jgi:hypothetical protein
VSKEAIEDETLRKATRLAVYLLKVTISIVGTVADLYDQSDRSGLSGRLMLCINKRYALDRSLKTEVTYQP